MTLNLMIPQVIASEPHTERIKNSAGKGNGMKIILPLLLVSIVFLVACTPYQAEEAAPTTGSGSESVDELGTQSDAVAEVEGELGLGDLEDIEAVLTEIENS